MIGLLRSEQLGVKMFQRIRDTLKKEKELKAQVSVEARAEGRAEGKAEGRAEVYRELTEWNRRRMEAEARGEKFTEPPPIPPQDASV